jgi:hypothetical protein
MRAAAVFLVVLGLAQMAGDVLGLPALRGLAAATAASPAPKVFSSVQGLETFSTRFTVEWIDAAGNLHAEAVTPAVYARLRGPYNRRNVYGAVVAYGPVLAASPATRPMLDAIARHALCGDAPLLRELGIEPAAVRGRPRLRLAPRAGTDPELPLVVEAPCA